MNREWASDVETLIFSDMIYEDFFDTDEGSLNDIFSENKRFYKPDESLRDERFKEYSMSIDKMNDWEFVSKLGTNGHKNDFDKKSFGDVIDKLQNDDKYLAQDLGADECYWDGESSGFYAAAFKNTKRDEIMIAYRGTNQNYEDHLMTNALIVSGIPSQQFEKATG